MHTILEEDAQLANAPNGSDAQKLGAFYRACMDVDAIEKAGTAPIGALLSTVDGARDVASLATTIAKLEHEGISGGLPLGARADLKDSSKTVAALSFGGLGLPDRDYYFNEGDRADKIRAAYRTYVATQLQNLGDDPAKAQDRSDGGDRARDRAREGDPETRRPARSLQVLQSHAGREAQRARAAPAVDGVLRGLRRDVVRHGRRQRSGVLYRLRRAVERGAARRLEVLSALPHRRRVLGCVAEALRRRVLRVNLRDWWTPSDAAAFKAKAQCIVDEFDAFEPAPGAHENGRLVQGEAIADLGGLTIAYRAFEKTAQAKAHASIDGYTPEQRFFLANAQVWRAVGTDGFIRQIAATDPHPWSKYRVLGTLSNMPEFQAAFTCAATDAMVRKNRCRIW